MTAVAEAGVDTVRWLYRLHDQRQQRACEHAWARPSKLGPMSVGYLPRHELVWVEGRPVTLLEPESTDLLHGDRLVDVEALVRERLRDLGLTDAREVGISRLDGAVTVRFDRPQDGWAALRGLAAVDAPRRKPDVIGRPPETVYWVTPTGVRQERAYDKGLESGRARPGTLIRLEAQMRQRTEVRTRTEWWNMERVRDEWTRRYGPMGQAADGLHVASEQTIREQLRELVERERITAAAAERLLGFIAAQSVGLPAPSRRTRFRRRAELRRLGIAQALDGFDDGDVDVDLAALLADALGTERWDG